MAVTDKNIYHQPYIIINDDLQSRGNEITIQTGNNAQGDMMTLFSVVNKRVMNAGNVTDYLCQIDIPQKQLRKLKLPVPKECRPCLSPSGKSFAYRLRTPITDADRTPLCRTFVKTPAVKQPAKISEGLGRSSVPVGWVEEVKQTTSRPKPGH